MGHLRDFVAILRARSGGRPRAASLLRGGVVAPRDPSTVLRRLEAVADQIGIASLQSHRYIVSGDVEIRRVHGLHDQLSWALSEGRLRSTCGAESVKIKNNFLGFYPTRGVALKVFEDEAGLAHHLEGRAIAEEALRAFRLPSLLYSGSEPAPYCAEELLSGVKPSALDYGHGEDLWRLHFLRSEVRRLALSDEEATQARSRLVEVGVAGALDPIIDRFRGLEVPVVFGWVHGDLGLGNMIQCGESIYLIDWEHFGFKPLVEDLQHLREFLPKVVDTYDRRFRELVERDVVTSESPVRDQLILRLLQRIAATDPGYFDRSLGGPSAFRRTIIVHWNRIRSLAKGPTGPEGVAPPEQ